MVMLTVFRGTITSPRVKDEVRSFMKTHIRRKRKWRELNNKNQLVSLKARKHCVLLGVSGPMYTMVFMKCSQGDRFIILDDGKTMCKLDLGSGLPSWLFNGTIFQVRYRKHTFHLCDVLLLGGDIPQNMYEAFQHLEKQVIPYFARSRCYDYAEIPQLTSSPCGRLLFIPFQGSDGWFWDNNGC